MSYLHVKDQSKFEHLSKQNQYFENFIGFCIDMTGKESFKQGTFFSEEDKSLNVCPLFIKSSNTTTTSSRHLHTIYFFSTYVNNLHTYLRN